MREFEGVDGLGVVRDETAAMELHFDFYDLFVRSVLLDWSASISFLSGLVEETERQ